MPSTASLPSIASLPTAFVYVATDVPYGQTLTEWRHERAVARHARSRGSFSILNLLRHLVPTTAR